MSYKSLLALVSLILLFVLSKSELSFNLGNEKRPFVLYWPPSVDVALISCQADDLVDVVQSFEVSHA